MMCYCLLPTLGRVLFCVVVGGHTWASRSAATAALLSGELIAGTNKPAKPMTRRTWCSTILRVEDRGATWIG